MPSATTDVYLTFDTGTAKNIEALIPTSFYQGALLSGTNPIDIATVVVHSAASSGTEDLQVEATFSGSGEFPTMFADFTEDTISSFITAETYLGTYDTDIDYTYGAVNLLYIDTLNTFLTAFKINEQIDVETDFSTGLLFDNLLNDTDVDFKIYKGLAITSRDTTVELFLHNDRKFIVNFDMYSVLQATPRYLDVDMESESGRIVDIVTDIYSALEIISRYELDVFSSAMNDIIYMDSDVEAVAGRIGFIDGNIFSTASGTNSIGCDIRTWSLNAANFFLDVGEHTTVSATAWVDVIDRLKGVSTSGTYFKVNGVEVPVTFSGITDGYRMYYNPPDDFLTEGLLVYTAHIRNNVGDERDQNYYLLRGYDLVHNDTIKWKADKQVDIWMTATNSGFCPNTSTDAYYFRTRELWYKDLSAHVTVVEAVDLGASIYPQSTAFFYGETYTITISGIKDYSGNVMDPFIHTFTIEDPTS